MEKKESIFYDTKVDVSSWNNYMSHNSNWLIILNAKAQSHNEYLNFVALCISDLAFKIRHYIYPIT